jgi:hypothetical protein
MPRSWASITFSERAIQSQKRRQNAGATFGNGEITRSEVEGPPLSVRCALSEDAAWKWLQVLM